MKNIFCFFFLILTTLTFAQPNNGNDEEPIAEISGQSRFNGIVVASSLNLGYSNGWIIGTTPSVGYRITDNFIAGVGIRYDYLTFNNPFSSIREVSNIIGGRAFLQHYLFRDFYAHVEYENLTGSVRQINRNTNQVIGEFRTQAPGVLIGGGYNSSFGFGFGSYIEVLYNIRYDPFTTPYNQPLIVRFGVSYGF